MPVNLVADRFADTGDGRVLDLATGDDVVLTIASAGGPTDQLRWTARCDWFQRLAHPSLATLVDYGLIGESRRFEAWRCGGARRESAADESAGGAPRRQTFLRACGLTASSAADGQPPFETVEERRAPLPSFRARRGVSVRRDMPSDPAFPVDNCGLVRVERRAMAAVAELFERTGRCSRSLRSCASGARTDPAGLRHCSIWRGWRVSTGSCRSTCGCWARRSRVCSTDASAFLIDDGTSAWRRGLLDAAIRSPQAHVVVFTSCEDARGVPGVGLARLSAAALTAAVRPSHVAVDDRVRRAAARADGLPGRFRSEAAGRPLRTRRPGIRRVGGGRAGSVLRRDRYAVVSRSGAGQPARLRRRRRVASPGDRGAGAAPAGRHAPGDRELRQAIGGLARRGDWEGASQGSLALAASLLKRGRPREAVAVLGRGSRALPADCRRRGVERAGRAVRRRVDRSGPARRGRERALRRGSLTTRARRRPGSGLAAARPVPFLARPVCGGGRCARAADGSPSTHRRAFGCTPCRHESPSGASSSAAPCRRPLPPCRTPARSATQA